MGAMKHLQDAWICVELIHCFAVDRVGVDGPEAAQIQIAKGSQSCSQGLHHTANHQENNQELA